MQWGKKIKESKKILAAYVSLHCKHSCLCPLDPRQITQPVAARQRTCRTSLAASSRAALPVTRLLTEASSQRETRRLTPLRQLQGLQTCFRGRLHKQGSLAQGPSGATPANTGLKEENPRAGARKFASHSSAEKCYITQRWSAARCHAVTRYWPTSASKRVLASFEHSVLVLWSFLIQNEMALNFVEEQAKRDARRRSCRFMFEVLFFLSPLVLTQINVRSGIWNHTLSRNRRTRA